MLRYDVTPPGLHYLLVHFDVTYVASAAGWELDVGGVVLHAWPINGSPLLRKHGFRLRLLVPGWYGMASVKWLNRIEVIDRRFDGFQQVGTYIYRNRADEQGVPVTTMRVKSLMVPPGIPDWYSRLRLIERGRVELFGRAWSGGGVPITKVEVAVARQWRET